MKRVLTTLVGIPILIYLVKFAPLPLFVGITLVAMLLSLYEYFQLTGELGVLSISWPAYILATAILLSFYLDQLHLAFYLPAGAMLILTAALFSRMEVSRALHATALSLFGAWYVGGLLGFLVGVRRIDGGGETGSDLAMILFVVIWAADIFAYIAGKTIGRHKLAAVSPKKTWEGAVAGFVFSILAALACRSIFAQQFSFTDAALMGALVGITGQVGDLCESLLKRAVNVKDSGSLIPGHGGMLDRLDSLFFGAPTMYYYFYLVLHK